MFRALYPALMAEYNAWMNEKVYDAAEELTDEERKRDRGAFFGSIHGTLDHLVWGDGGWLFRFTGTRYATGPVGVILYDDWGALREARRTLDAAILTWAKGVDQAWLDEAMTWKSQLYGFTQTQPRWVQVTQMFNHQTHHRGQVTALLAQAGVSVGVTDVPLTPVLGDTLVREG